MEKYEIFVVGAGGTGSYFLKEFSRFIHGSKYQKMCEWLHIIDGDTVEEKNLARQCFTPEDVGRNKAAVMAEVLNDAFGLSWKSHPFYLSDVKQINEMRKSSYTAVIISCVDNHACRLILEEYFHNSRNVVYLDSANEFDTGECVYSYKEYNKVIGPVRSHYFPEIKEGDNKSRLELSCEELNNVEPQHIFTNMFAGQLLCAGIANLLEGKKTPGFTYFNALNYESAFVPYAQKEQVVK